MVRAIDSEDFSRDSDSVLLCGIEEALWTSLVGDRLEDCRARRAPRRFAYPVFSGDHTNKRPALLAERVPP